MSRPLYCATQLATSCVATAPTRPTPAPLILHLRRNPDVDWPRLIIGHLGARVVMIISNLQVALTAAEPNVLHTWGTFHVSATARRRVRSITLRPYAPPLKNTSELLASRELSLETAMDVLKTAAERDGIRLLTHRGKSWRMLKQIQVKSDSTFRVD